MSQEPKQVDQVMVSSTFTDLQQHRQKLIDALRRQKLFPCAMENDTAKSDGDLIKSSLDMVADSAAYICLIAFKYGQTPECDQRNRNVLSITELEFNEALRLKRPILLFLMGDQHDIKKADLEKDAEKEQKLNAFRERAKQFENDVKVHRVYKEFNSLEAFEISAVEAIAGLRRDLDAKRSNTHTSVATLSDAATVTSEAEPATSSLPQPPAPYFKPAYIATLPLVGRKAQREELNDWASPNNPHNVWLYHAIGGNGKSALTWHWFNHDAPQTRGDWAGRFWYSFYEQGAVMEEFCRHALAYMTGRPLEHYKKRRTLEMREELLQQLQSRPWLLVLDGLERVLVAYHRLDAAELSDEESETPTDVIAKRNARDTIRDEDHDLLRALSAAAPSKLLISSRLVPRALLNPAQQDLPGVATRSLGGLLADDAEAMFRACGIRGDSATIQRYLSQNCDNHPLVIGVIAGLVNDYLPEPGNFDRWLADPAHGAALDFGQLNLVQRRNHILEAAIQALPAESRELLSLLALLQEAVDYATLQALNPFAKDIPQRLMQPQDPRHRDEFSELSESDRDFLLKAFEEEKKQYQEAVNAYDDWLRTPKAQAAQRQLEDAASDLRQRGLMQYEQRLCGQAQYNLHPVVRSVAATATDDAQRGIHGNRAVDYFNSLPHRPYDEVEMLEEIAPALHNIRICLKLGQWQRAMQIYMNGVGGALRINLGAYAEILELLQPLFDTDWSNAVRIEESHLQGYVLNEVAIALFPSGPSLDAIKALEVSISRCLKTENWSDLQTVIRNMSEQFKVFTALYQSLRSLNLAKYLGDACKQSQESDYMTLDRLADAAARMGLWEEVESHLLQRGSNPPTNCRELYRPGDQEYGDALRLFWRGKDPSADIARALHLAKSGRNRLRIGYLHQLQGDWSLQHNDWQQARQSYEEVVRMARERNRTNEDAETGLALAKYHLGALSDARAEAERLAHLRDPAHFYLTRLWQALGDVEKAKHHARAAYKMYWADGEPYVFRYWLDRTIELLHALNEPIPQLPPFDASKYPPFPWEADLLAAIDRLNAEKAAKAASTSTPDSPGLPSES